VARYREESKKKKKKKKKGKRKARNTKRRLAKAQSKCNEAEDAADGDRRVPQAMVPSLAPMATVTRNPRNRD
jgi:hypothetical protein